MKNIISISTGLVYKFESDRNKMIQMLKKFSPDGIEISFFSTEALLNFEISDQNVQYLKTLPYVTLHAPWVNIRYSNNSSCLEVLNEIDRLYKQIDAKNVTLEPGEVDDYSVFDKCSYKISTENSDYRKPFKTPGEIEEVLKNNPRFGLTFDFAHALTIDPSEADKFFNIDRISQVHMAYFSKELSDHSFLSKHPSAEIEKRIAQIPESIPFVLECVAEAEEQIDWVKNEIEYLRKVK
jgi:sugar phosphate isomerase/epimerase